MQHFLSNADSQVGNQAGDSTQVSKYWLFPQPLWSPCPCLSSMPGILGTLETEVLLRYRPSVTQVLPQAPVSNFCKLFAAFSLLYLLAVTSCNFPSFLSKVCCDPRVQIHSFLTEFSNHPALVVAARVVVSWRDRNGTISCCTRQEFLTFVKAANSFENLMRSINHLPRKTHRCHILCVGANSLRESSGYSHT